MFTRPFISQGSRVQELYITVISYQSLQRF